MSRIKEHLGYDGWSDSEEGNMRPITRLINEMVEYEMLSMTLQEAHQRAEDSVRAYYSSLTAEEFLNQHKRAFPYE